MAATAVYISVDHMLRDDFKVTLDAPVLFSNISATTAAFTLSGGLYTVKCMGSTFGTVTLQVLGGDGTTWITALAAIAANSLSAATRFPPGSYRFAIA